MANGYSRGPKLLKGALIQFNSALVVPVPNIIVFQYNPESLSRSLTAYDPGAQASNTTPTDPARAPDLIQPHDPGESFTLSLFLDASDALEAPESHPVAFVSGVADRISAMEMLLYPLGDSLLGGLLGSVNVSVSVSVGSGGLSASASASVARTVRRPEVPVVLFVWGPGRILPVRLSSMTVEEQAYNTLLYPIRAKVSLSLKVMTKEDLGKISDHQKAARELAKFAYDFTRGQKEVLATANIANTVESILGMLPF
jgi:hypothetical protein